LLILNSIVVDAKFSNQYFTVLNEARNFESSYTSHGPIFISSNQDFIDQGWPGNGSEINPYMIEGLNITSSQICIEIRNVDVHFTVKGCHLQPTALNYTIKLLSCDNGTIDNCEIYSEYRGIRIDKCNEIAMMESYVTVYDWAAAEFVDSTFCNVTGCSFFESEATTFPMRVSLQACENAVVNDCFFDTAVLQVNWCPNITIMNNIFDTGGITIGSHTINDPPFNYTITGNFANGKPIIYLESTTDTIIPADNYAQVILMDCNDILVRNGIMENVPYGVQILHSNSCSVENLRSQGTTQAVMVYYSNNTEVSGCIIDSEFGFSIAMYYSYDCLIRDNVLSGHEYGGATLVYVGACEDTVVEGNNISSTTHIGIEVSGFDCIIRENKFDDCYTSLRVSGARLQINENTILRASDDHISPPNSFGILAAPLWNSSVFGNEILDGDDWGILYLGNGTQFVENRIAYNSGIGLEIYEGSTNNSIYGNIFDRNVAGNAIDNGFLNCWDNNVSSGNLWSDYDYVTGGPYSISGVASSQDRYPLVDDVAPVISHPADIHLEQGVFDANISWAVSDILPNQYWLYQNGEELYHGTWRSGTLDFTLQVEDEEVYNITLVLSDLYGNLVSDTVFILRGTPTPTTYPSTIDHGLIYIPMFIIIPGILGLILIAVVMIRREILQNPNDDYLKCVNERAN